MDKSLILSLVFDGRCYGDKICLFDIKEYSKTHHEFFGICERLCKDLSEDEKRDILDKISDALCAMECVAADEFFKAGFKLGLKLGAQNFLD